MMDPVISARPSVIDVPVIDVSSDHKRLTGILSDIPMAMYKAAKLNVTFDNCEKIFGIADESGQFNGLMGRIQNNLSDFSVFPVTLESFQGNFDMPVKILSLMGQYNYYIVSHPDYNRTESVIRSDIEGSLAVMGPFAFALHLFLLFSTFFSITMIHKFFLSPIKIFVPLKCGQVFVGRRKKRFKIKLPKISRMKLAWNIIRYSIAQGLPMEFPLKTQLIIFLTMTCSTGILISLYNNYFKTDLVSYKKPLLLDTLQDVLDAEDKVNISFLEASSALGEFMHSPVGSIENRLYRRSLKQWNGKKENYHLIRSNLMLIAHHTIKKHNLAFFSSEIPSLIVLNVECSRSDSDPDLYSNLYRSKDSFMHENQIQVARIGIDGQLEERLTKWFTIIMESGFQEIS